MKYFWTLLVVFFVVNQAFASEMLVSDNIWTAVDKAQALAKKYGADQVLFVSDLDNTLLKTKQDLASEPWFNWQEGLLHENGPDIKNEKRIACDIRDLLQFFNVSITLSQTDPVQDDQAKAIASMQDVKPEARIATMALTARGDQVASATFRELAKNGIDFSKTSPLGDGFGDVHLPWDSDHFQASGLSQADVEKLKLGKARPVSYQRGVFFCDGQNKGALLKSFLHKIGRSYKGIVFWDNDKKNNQRMFDAFEGTGVELYAIRATRQDADIKRFDESDKQKVTDDFVLLRKLLDQAYLYPRPCPLPIDKLVKAK